MREYYISPLRLKRGAASLAALAANFNTISLFNDGQGQFILLLRDIMVSSGPAGNMQAGYFKGTIGTVQTTQVTIIPEATQLPGSIYTQTATTVPGTVTEFWGGAATGNNPWFHNFPFAALPPGWSYFVSNGAVNQSATVSFVWECVYMGNIQAPDDITATYEQIAAALPSA